MRNKLREKLKERKGFTLIEMMIVVAVIAILTGLVSVGIYGYRYRWRAVYITFS